jgi:ATP-dependent RNA helicase DDX27
MKELLKGEGGLLGGGDHQGGEGKVLSRTIPPAVITKFTQQIHQLESKIEKAMSEERLRSRLDVAMREAERAQNLIEHEDEISARPARTWYQSESAKRKTKVAAKAAVESGVGSKVATTAQEKALALARSDDYRREENTSKEHRLSRKKRRRLEALREDAGVSGGGIGAKEAVAKARESETRMLKAVSRKAKANTLEQAAAFRDRDLGGSSGGGNKGKKVKSHVRAIGGLDQDSGLMDWDGGAQPGLSSKERKKAAREKEFTDFDPNMRLRKGGKVGRASFKSSKKFKRR